MTAGGLAGEGGVPEVLANDEAGNYPLLLTGATGFVGQALWKILDACGYIVRGAGWRCVRTLA